MPRFIDHHKPPTGVTPAMMQQLAADIKAGKANKDGVKGLNGFIGKNDAWCFVEAPNAAAVHKLHEEVYKMNLGPGDVVEVQSIV